MNYYEHHLGDYAKDTAHLSMLEHGAYRLLLDRYYGSEQGIPADQAHRIARARTKDERQAVDVVLAEFFKLVDGLWINKRADEEIAKAKVKIAAAQENGKKGGRPRKFKSGSENETQQKHGGFSVGSENETQQKHGGFSVGSENETQQKHGGFSVGSENETQQKAHQTPDTKHQTPLKPSTPHTVPEPDSPPRGTTAASAPIANPSPAGEVCLAIREEGIPTTNPSHPTLIALIEAGADPSEFRHAAREAVRKGKPDFAYVVGTVRRRREEAAELVLHKGRMPNKQEALEEANRAATAGWRPPELREQSA